MPEVRVDEPLQILSVTTTLASDDINCTVRAPHGWDAARWQSVAAFIALHLARITGSDVGDFAAGVASEVERQAALVDAPTAHT